MSDSHPAESPRKQRIPPALALWLVTPVFGELFSGSTPLNEYLSPFIVLIFGMLYGSGAILIRELLIRWRKGWLSLLLLGMAFGIYEEGLVVRSFFDPHWIDLGDLGVYGRVAGINLVWAEHLTIYHALISIAASIAFVEILYAGRRTESWVGERGLAWNLAAFTAMLLVGALLNPYDTPDAWLGVCWLAMALLVLAARRAPVPPKEGPPVKVPRPRRFGLLGFAATFAHFFIVSVTAENNDPPFFVGMILIALPSLFTLWLVQRWSDKGKSWDDRHRLALLSGSLSFFLIAMPIVTNGQYPITCCSNPAFLLLFAWVYRKVNGRFHVESLPTEKIPSIS
ncbi:MAG: hypothetical protein ACOYYS_14910 [Chloroflexota bacterium]